MLNTFINLQPIVQPISTQFFPPNLDGADTTATYTFPEDREAQNCNRDILMMMLFFLPILTELQEGQGKGEYVHANSS